ncbi:thioredoxin-like domain-containing protein [Planctomicrobium sp. SH664]|uniref:thioredoxin-like domain-containing protein n=1 Tax=Planctomicrobium sp. SH664 TaxID=3448125 RepID=UPI003F5C9A4B
MSQSRRFCLVLCLFAFLSGGSSALAQPATEAAPVGRNPYPGQFVAPSLEGGTEWLNTTGPIELPDLRGKIVILDFWTYCCINCIHILPDLKYLEKKYPNELVVIGVHSAKFENERDSENIRQAILRYEIAHPVINDSNMVVARKYGFNSWPTLVVIDPEGKVVGTRSGEGHRELLDQVVGQLAAYHRAKGTLDEKPVHFNLEKEKVDPTPLRYPGKLFVDLPKSRLFVSDSNHNRIVVSSLDGTLIDVIGTGQIGANDGGFTEATFDHPQGLQLVGDILYVADTENHLLRTINLKTRQVATLAGTGQQGSFRGRGGKLRQTALNSPWALQELQGTLYIAMAGPHQIWKHGLKSDSIEPYAGSGREDILDGPRFEAALAQPSDITTDGRMLYHVDSEGSAVRKIDRGTQGGVQTLVGPHDLDKGASLFTFGDRDGVGDEVRLQHPLGLVWHNRALYVADSYNHKIKRVDPITRTCVTWLGTGERGNSLSPVQLSEPAGLAIAGDQLLIADTNNHRILQVDLVSRQTRELIIRGLTPPAAAQPTQDDMFRGETHQVEATTIKPGESLEVRINFSLPIGHHLNELAPVVCKLTAEPGQTIIPPEFLAERHTAESLETAATLQVPLTSTSGSTRLTLTVSYQFCRLGKGGVCRFATQRWEIPVSVAAGGVEQLALQGSPQQ